MACDVLYLVEEHPAGAAPMTYWFQAYRDRERARAAVSEHAARRGAPLDWRQQGRNLAGFPRTGTPGPTYLIVALPVT
ncbi:MAG: hypothetical protein ACYCO9_04420 [Streptosporangiaceae bacterium]